MTPMSSTPSGPEHSSPALQVLPTCSRCASTECGPPGPPWTHNDGCKIPRSSTLEVQITRGRSVAYYGPWCDSFHKKAGLFNSITKSYKNIPKCESKTGQISQKLLIAGLFPSSFCIDVVQQQGQKMRFDPWMPRNLEWQASNESSVGEGNA